jgi:hypothetical protein
MASSAALIVIAWLAAGQPPAAPSLQAANPPPSPKGVEAFKVEAAGYVMRLEKRPGEKLALQKEPVLRWDNPARTGEDGALFVWTSQGRPEAIATIFTYRYNDKLHRKHEVHSLALGPLTAEFGGKAVWTPRAAGVTFAPVPSAPEVAATPRQRLSQMKALTRDFAASMRDLEGEQFQLRLLTQPLLRYEPKDGRVLDGALFAFSLGTDPEVLLLLEARAAGDSHQWQYALARFHYIDLTVTHSDRKVWHVDPLPDILNLDIGASEYRDSAYTTYHVERNLPAE